jgi:hypothetical protein
MGRDSLNGLNLRRRRREALAPALSTKKSAPYGSKRTVRTPRPGRLFAFTPDLNPERVATRDGRVTLPSSLLIFLFATKFWIGRRDGGAIRESSRARTNSVCLPLVSEVFWKHLLVFGSFRIDGLVKSPRNVASVVGASCGRPISGERRSPLPCQARKNWERG